VGHLVQSPCSFGHLQREQRWPTTTTKKRNLQKEIYTIATPTGEFQYVGIAPEAMSWYLRFGLHGDEDKLGNLEFAIPVGRIPSFTKWMRNAGDWVDDAWFWTTRGI
jgi:hypothetical protein